MQWNKYFHLVNGTFHLLPHENICTIALINIHYLYNSLNWSAFHSLQLELDVNLQLEFILFAEGIAAEM